MFYKKNKVSIEFEQEGADDGQKTGCETGGASTNDQAQQHMADIRDFIDFQEDDSEDEDLITEAKDEMNMKTKSDSDEASNFSEISVDSEVDNQIMEFKPVNPIIKARLDSVRHLTDTIKLSRNQQIIIKLN